MNFRERMERRDRVAIFLCGLAIGSLGTALFYALVQAAR